MDLRKDSRMATEKELKKFNDDLLKSCCLTQEAISKTSGVLMFFDAQKMQETIDNNKKIGVFCNDFQEYFSGVINQHQPEGENSKFIFSGIAVNRTKANCGSDCRHCSKPVKLKYRYSG
ncbi:MAG: hypothetical protein WC574_07095 [Candidatus Omnitrophota bacterium]